MLRRTLTRLMSLQHSHSIPSTSSSFSITSTSTSSPYSTTSSDLTLETLRKITQTTTVLPPAPTSWQEPFTPSPRVASFAAQNNLAFSNALRMFPGQNVQSMPLRISLCPKRAFNFYHQRYFEQYEHPLTEKTLHFYEEEMKKKPLWCYVHCSGADGSNTVVRTAARRYLTKVLAQALEREGYELSGRSLKPGEKELRGTIQVVVTEGKTLLNMDGKKLEEYVGLLVRKDIVPRLSGRLHQMNQEYERGKRQQPRDRQRSQQRGNRPQR